MVVQILEQLVISDSGAAEVPASEAWDRVLASCASLKDDGTARLDVTANMQSLSATSSLGEVVTAKDRKALEVLGLDAYDRVPGPKIQAKTKAAQKLAATWWEQLRAKAMATLAGVDISGVGTSIITETRVHATLRVLKSIVKGAYPSLQQMQSARAVMTALSDSDDDMATVDLAQHVYRVVKADPCSIQACMLQQFVDWKTLNARVVDMLMTARESEARRLLSLDMFSNSLADSSAKQFAHVVLQKQESIKNEIEGLADAMRMSELVKLATTTSCLNEFIGLLSVGIPGRDEAYNDLFCALLSAETCAPAVVNEKIWILVTGSYEGHAVFSRGNPCLPLKAMQDAMMQRMGVDEFMRLRGKVYGSRRLTTYRNGLPNRHGSSNENPHVYWECPLCIASKNMVGR